MLTHLFVRRPHWYLLVLFLILLLFSIPLKGKTIDLQLHDTYLVLSAWRQAGIILLFLLISSALYWVVRHKPKVKWMTIFHLSAVSLFAVVIVLLCYQQLPLPGSSTIVLVILAALIAFLTAQPVFLINLYRAWKHPENR